MIRGVVDPGDYRIGRTERSIGRQLAWLDRHEEALERFDEAIRILSMKGPDSDEVLAVTVDRARSMLALERDLEATARSLARVVSVQERLARERSNPELLSIAAENRLLLDEIESALRRQIEQGRFENRSPSTEG